MNDLQCTKKEKKIKWSEEKLNAWRKNLIGKTWEIFWEPTSDDGDGGDVERDNIHCSNDDQEPTTGKRQNELLDTSDKEDSDDDDDDDDDGEWEADWYDGFIQSYSARTKYFSIIFVGEEDKMYSMKLTPKAVRPLMKNMENREAEDENKIKEDNSDSNICTLQSNNDDYGSSSDEAEFHDMDYDEDKYNSSESDDEVVYTIEKKDNRSSGNCSKVTSSKNIVSNQDYYDHYRQQRQSSSIERKRKHKSGQKTFYQQVNAVLLSDLKIKRKKKRRKEDCLVIPACDVNMKIKHRTSNNEMMKGASSNKIISSDQTEKEQIVVERQSKIPLANNAKIAKNSDQTEKECQLTKPIMRKKRQRPSLPQASFRLATTLAIISNKEEEGSSLPLEQKQYNFEHTSIEERATLHLPDPKSKSTPESISIKKELPSANTFLTSYHNIKMEDNNSTAKIYSPPRGAVPQCTVPQFITKTNNNESELVRQKHENGNDMMHERQRYYLSKKIKHKQAENKLLKNDIKPILSKTPKYSSALKKACDKDDNVLGVKSDPDNYVHSEQIVKKFSSLSLHGNLLHSLCSKMMRRVKFVDHLNETRLYVADKIEDILDSQIKIEKDLVISEQQALIIDKFVKRQQQQKQEATKNKNETSSSLPTKNAMPDEEQQVRQKKKLLAYAAVNGTMDDMIACLNNGASARGGKEEKPLDKVKEAKSELKKVVEYYAKRDTLINDLLKLSDNVNRKISLLTNLWKKNSCNRDFYMRISKSLRQLDNNVHKKLGPSIGLLFCFDPLTSTYLKSDIQPTKIKADVLALKLEKLERKHKVLKIFKEIEVISDLARSLHPKLHKIDRNRESFKQMRKDCAKRIKIVCDWIKRFHMNSTASKKPGENNSGGDEDPNKELAVINVNISQHGSLTMLHAATCIFAINSINDLMKQGAKIDIKSDEFGTVMDLAKDLSNEAKSRGDKKYENAFRDVIRHLGSK